MNASSSVAAAGTGFGLQTLESFLESRTEPAWVTENRRRAFDQYLELSKTSLPPEEWKRVDLRALRPDQFHIAAEAPAQAEASTFLGSQTDFGGTILHADGHLVRRTLQAELEAKGVLFGSLAELLQTHGDRLKPHLMTRAFQPDMDRFSAWHAAFWTGGTVLFVPRNVEITAPLHSVVALSGDKAADFSHTLIVLEDGASATLLEETASLTSDKPGLHVGAVELILGAGSRLRYVQLQNWNQKTWHIAHQRGCVDRDAFLQWTVGGLGGRVAHTHQEVTLDGPGAVAEVNGATFAVDKQVISYYTQQTHNAPNTRSDLLYKDVLRDHSRVIWRGMIKVAKAAQKTDGYQRNDGLVLTDTARADAIPGLEIEADDVRCTHGATVGQVDEEQIFYCMGRGLSRREAMHMIVEGFFQRVYDRIPVPAVQEALHDAVERKLGLGGVEG